MRSELGLAVELAGLVGLAFVQPVLGPFGDSPETFSAFGASSRDIVVFALLVALLPLVALWAVGAASRAFGDVVRDRVQTLVVGVLAGLAATYVVRQAGGGAAVRVVVALVVAAVVMVARHRWTPARLFLRYSAPLPVLVVGVFLFASPVAPLVLPSSDHTAARSTSAEHPPVVVIVLDELPTLSLVDGTGGIDAELVPNLARMAATSTWYRNHTSASPATGTSLPVLLTGRDPDDPGNVPTPNDAEFPDNLLARMSGDYQINGAEWSTSFCPDDLCPRRAELDGVAGTFLRASTAGEAAPLDSLVDEGRSLWWSQVWPLADDFDAGFSLGGSAEIDDQRRRTLEFLDAIDEPAGDRPVFDYLHTALPHQPWDLLPSGRAYDAPEFPYGGEFLRAWPQGDFGKELALAARSQHLLQLQWADRLLGAIFDRLQQVDRWDDALVVVTADHGVSFQPGTSLRDVVPANQVDLAWAPLFIKLPGQTRAAVDDDDVSSLDLLPTVLDVAGLDGGADLPGRSLAEGAVPADRPRPFIAPAEAGFETQLRDGIVALDADGLDVLESGGASEGYVPRKPDDELAVWRHGRHADLLGRTVDDLGVCAEPGPAATRQVSDDWSAYVDGSLPGDRPLPLWQSGTLATGVSVDVAVAVGGVFAGWGSSIPDGDGNRFGVLVAEPLVRKGAGDPVLYEVVDQPGCRLRPMEG